MTTYYDVRKTADYSPYVVHFTKARRFTAAGKVTASDPLFAHRRTGAREKLVSILESRTIYASPMPFLPKSPRAVCFTECIWDALVELSDSYSPYGVVFLKRLIQKRGGGPALYVRGDTLKGLGTEIPPALEAMISPFDPDAVLSPPTVIDFLHEREWRLPGQLVFRDEDLEYLIVNTIADADSIVKSIGPDRVPLDKVVVMEVYRTICKAWRVK